jgi:uridine kinase
VKPYLIGIGGASCSGKTVLAREMVRRLGKDQAVIVPLDMYYIDLSELDQAARARHNFDAPEAMDWPLLTEQLELLAQGRAVDGPVYDFATHTRTQTTRRITPRAVMVVEGLLALHSARVRHLFGTKVFVRAPDAVCLARREERDLRERGRTLESVRAQYAATVRPMAEQYVLPTEAFADVVVDGEDDVKRSCEAVLAHMKQQVG